MRRLLLPGTHVLSRPDGAVQVGLDSPDAVVLPDSPPVRDLLAALRDGQTGPGGHTGSVLRRLQEQGLVVHEAAARVVGPSSGDAARRHRQAALTRRVGDRAPETARDLDGLLVETVGFGPAHARTLLTEAVELVGAAGLGTVPASRRSSAGARRTGRQARPAPGHATSRLGLAVGIGEPERELLDGWVHDGVPHVVVRLMEGRALVGPFVAVGRTACLRCVDAHRTDADPAWPLLVAQYARLTRSGRVDGVPEPVDPALAAIASAWAVRDLLTYAEGGRPSTWSATLRLGARLDEVEATTWLRHPDCGCSWE